MVIRSPLEQTDGRRGAQTFNGVTLKRIATLSMNNRLLLFVSQQSFAYARGITDSQAQASCDASALFLQVARSEPTIRSRALDQSTADASPQRGR